MFRFVSISRLAVLSCLLCTTYVATASAQGDCPEPTWPPLGAYIYGEAGWYSTGDIIQFVGDTDDASPIPGGCGSYEWGWSNCHIDTGFTFREVFNFNAETCSYTAGDICDVVKVRCCFFWDNEVICGICSTCCGVDDLCKSFWEVVAFYADGLTGRGCWELDYVSDCTIEDCDDGVDMCNSVRRWYD